MDRKTDKEYLEIIEKDTKILIERALYEIYNNCSTNDIDEFIKDVNKILTELPWYIPLESIISEQSSTDDVVVNEIVVAKIYSIKVIEDTKPFKITYDDIIIDSIKDNEFGSIYELHFFNEHQLIFNDMLERSMREKYIHIKTFRKWFTNIMMKTQLKDDSGFGFLIKYMSKKSHIRTSDYISYAFIIIQQMMELAFRVLYVKSSDDIRFINTMNNIGNCLSNELVCSNILMDLKYYNEENVLNMLVIDYIPLKEEDNSFSFRTLVVTGFEESIDVTIPLNLKKELYDIMQNNSK